jgi:glycerol-3-phosphate O-acyltransferase/dihydroxyacetone phosphate acyltransferase
MKRPFIGHAARMLEAIAVTRSQDLAKVGSGTLKWHEGLTVTGTGTRFLSEVEAGASLKVAGQQTTPAVVRVVSDTELEIKFPFEAPVDGKTFKIWPKLDHAQVYSAVWSRLADGGAIGIFPEGGSHDNPHLLPLKAGVTVMALGAMDLHSSLVVKIIPVGLNYIHGHRFRSHVMVEYGKPIEVPWSLVLHYRQDRRCVWVLRVLFVCCVFVCVCCVLVFVFVCFHSSKFLYVFVFVCAFVVCCVFVFVFVLCLCLGVFSQYK